MNRGAETNIQQFAARLWVDDVAYTGNQRAAGDYQLLIEEEFRDVRHLVPSVRTIEVDLIDLEDTKTEPLKPRIGREGWISFVFNDVKIEIVDDYKLKPDVRRLEITVTDGSGEPHKAETTGPWECPGKIAKGPIKWKRLSSPFDAFE